VFRQRVDSFLKRTIFKEFAATGIVQVSALVALAIERIEGEQQTHVRVLHFLFVLP